MLDRYAHLSPAHLWNAVESLTQEHEYRMTMIEANVTQSSLVNGVDNLEL
jgi:hypothetical protein